MASNPTAALKGSAAGRYTALWWSPGPAGGGQTGHSELMIVASTAGVFLAEKKLMVKLQTVDVQLRKTFGFLFSVFKRCFFCLV